MQARMNRPSNPDVTTAVGHLYKAVHSGGVDPRLLELVHLRASQINGCSPCVYAGVASAKKHGGDRRAAAQPGGLARDAVLHRRRACGARVHGGGHPHPGRRAGVTDEIWDAAAAYFDEDQLSSIILHIA